MATRVRLAAAFVAAVAGVVLLIAAHTPAGGADRPRSTPPTNAFAVTETYEAEDPALPVATRNDNAERFTTLFIPRLDLRVPIVKGTDEEALARGVGWWENDTEPGGKGNYVLAGHRVTNGEPFADIPELRRGDQVIIETPSYRYVYELDTRGDAYRVDDADMWPVDEMPRPMRGGPNRILTLITCAETFETADRFISFGHLVEITLRDGAPGRG